MSVRNSRLFSSVFKSYRIRFWSSYMEEKGVVYCSIESKLQETLKPTHLEVFNQSSMHNVPKGSETHFKVVVVSELFEGLPLIKRHRLVNEALKEELETGVHALSIQARTPSQWEQSNVVTESPPCLGGSKR